MGQRIPEFQERDLKAREPCCGECGFPQANHPTTSRLDRTLWVIAALILLWLVAACSSAHTPEGVAKLKARCVAAGMESRIINTDLGSVNVQCRDKDGAVYEAANVGD